MGLKIITLLGCHTGLLVSADSVLEAMQGIPFPEGVFSEKPVASWRGNAAAQGIEGKVIFGGGRTLKLLTDPEDKSVAFSIEVTGAGRTSKKAVGLINEYFREYFGAE